MATPRRRSSRVRQSSAAARMAGEFSSPSKLTTLVERQDTPDQAKGLSLNALASPESCNNVNVTPTTAGALKPTSDEMHPSHFHSTAKKIASEHRFGFNVASKPQTPTKQATATNAPPSSSPTRNPNQERFSSPTFEFRFTRPSTDLSSEAQRMMDEVREQAAKIKAELAAQRDEQMRKDGEADTLFGIGGRKIAKPKGRFSDVHKDHFKKMDSIAGHASAFRADPAKVPTPKQSLKRSNSKAELDKPQVTPKKSAGSVPPVSTPDADQGPPKRRRTMVSQPATLSRLYEEPADSPKTGAPTLSRAKSARLLPVPNNGFATPTKPSLPRPASAHVLRTSGIANPSLLRSASTKSIATEPRPGQHRSAFANKLSSGVKSILRRPQIRFSNDPSKVAAGTHASTPTKQSLNKGLPDLSEGAMTPSRREKHVNFSPSPTYFEHGSPAPTTTPSPIKPVTQPVSLNEVVYYPSLPGSFQSDIAQEKQSSIKERQAPGDFTFRANNTISFAQSPESPSTPTIRKVFEAKTPLFKLGSAVKIPMIPGVPHGLSNKKRKRDSEVVNSVEEDKENREGQTGEQGEESPTKRRKTIAMNSPAKTRMPPSTRKPESSAKKKGLLSFSRLQELAKPKQRA